jgi:NAD(P)-dependent dehydrogenase (short-subunit alcohol dehydrogenase family)
MGTLSGLVALVTGASRGIGAATAVELGRRGAHVILVARTQGGLEETDDAIRAAGGTATLLPLDLQDGAGLDPVGPSVFQRFGRLDILVHNAGALGKLTPVGHIQPRDWDAVVGVNLAATWRLIRTCAPPLQAAPAGRAVFVTTGVAVAPRAYWGAYGATKAGMEHLVLTWAAEVTTTNLRINLFDPGVVASRMRADAMPGEKPATLPQPADVAPALADLCEPSEARHGQRVVAPALSPSGRGPG